MEYTYDSRITDELSVIAQAVERIKRYDPLWRDPHPDSDKEHQLIILEAGSTGVHEGYCDDIGYWIFDEDTWPSHPLLVRYK